LHTEEREREIPTATECEDDDGCNEETLENFEPLKTLNAQCRNTKGEIRMMKSKS
jgi:hypothetical protein